MAGRQKPQDRAHHSARGKRILIICPAKPGTQFGNRIRALRYQSIFRQLGYPTRISDRLSNQCDIVVALHAFRSSAFIAESKSRFPNRPVVLVVTGTDLYRDGPTSASQLSFAKADRIVVAQPTMVNDLPKQHHHKTHTIFQSARGLSLSRPQKPRSLRVIVSGHLRPVKDPFRAAMAVRNLPTKSKIIVEHYGSSLDNSMTIRALAEAERNARYRWLGEIPRGQFRRKLATAWVMVLSSKMEGGANVLSEAIAVGTPVLASRIAGSTGLLGEQYGGLFETGDTPGLRKLLLTCESDQEFYRSLQKQVAKRKSLVDPSREMHSWSQLLASLT